ncbi:MAG: SGNH/GDSL hydrolase family protein, partial [Rhodospirillales bacterium]
PGERIIVSNPDSGEIFSGVANNHGWRDRNRSFDKPSGVFRILVLGDSNTFGAIVPAEKVYTTQLEDKLRAEGFAVEIVNMSYGGWSTDQELEAFINEGRKYQPDLVVVQFTVNDIGENLNAAGGNRLKPFSYALTESGILKRSANAAFAMSQGQETTFRYWLKEAVSSSEILKRAYLFYNIVTHQSPHIARSGYFVSPHQYLLIKYLLKADEQDSFVQFLERNLNSEITQESIDLALTGTPHAGRREKILELLKSNWIHDYWDLDAYERKVPDTNATGWRLTFALLQVIRDEAAKINAPVWILSDQEEGAYQWERYWERISPSQETRLAFLSVNDVLADFAESSGMEMVTLELPHTRARLDPHPNIEGNRAMAENLYRHLMRRLGERLPRLAASPASL